MLAQFEMAFYILEIVLLANLFVNVYKRSLLAFYIYWFGILILTIISFRIYHHDFMSIIVTVILMLIWILRFKLKKS